MSYLDKFDTSKEILERSSNRLTIKLSTDIRDDVVSGFCYLGWMRHLSIENFFSVSLTSPSYMNLIELVSDYFDCVDERRKFTQEFETFLKNDWILDITTMYGFSIEFTKKDVVHLLRTPIFATYKNVVFFNYEERNFLVDTKHINLDLLPISIVNQEVAQRGWQLASN